MKCMHFSDDMVFLPALLIFSLFSDENQDIFFNLKKKNARPCHFCIFFKMRTKTFIFRGLTI